MITRFLLLALTLHFVFGSANLHASLESDYQLARDAVQKGKSAQFAKIAATFPDDHLLTPYIRYWQLKADMATDRATDRASGNKARDSVSAQQAFIRQYADSPLSNRLRTELARKNGIQADWSAFLANYAEIVRPDQELLCLAMRARQATGDVNQRMQADSAGIELWRTARDLPSSCEPIFDSLAERGLLTLEDRLARLRLALDDGNLRKK